MYLMVMHVSRIKVCQTQMLVKISLVHEVSSYVTKCKTNQEQANASLGLTLKRCVLFTQDTHLLLRCMHCIKNEAGIR